jgi:hypothetical protein
LSTHPCVDCREDDIIVLEFDHVRGSKRKELSRLVNAGASVASLLAEVEKCEVRCANCHRRVTHARRLARADVRKRPIETTSPVISALPLFDSA